MGGGCQEPFSRPGWVGAMAVSRGLAMRALVVARVNSRSLGNGSRCDVHTSRDAIARDNHLSMGRDMKVEVERRIRERAYAIWEQEGRPHGRDLDHRLRAEAEIAAERGRGGAGTSQQPDVRGDDRERLNKAAEALFTPKQSKESGTATADKSARKPRVLPSLPKGPVHQERIDQTISAKPVTPVKIAGLNSRASAPWSGTA